MTYQELEERLLGNLTEECDFETLALEVYRFQRRHNLHYDAYCRALGVAETIENWASIPPVPQVAFKQFGLRSFPEEETRVTFRTSGTSGEGYGEHHFASLELYRAACLAGFRRLGLPCLRQFSLIASADEAPHSSLSRMVSYLAGEGVSQTCCMAASGPDLAALESGIASSNEPVLILGTALAFLHWMRTLKGEAFPLPEGSFVFETGGYKGSGETLSREDFHKQLGAALRLPTASIVNEYGMTELSSQFYARGNEIMHRSGPWVRARIVNPEKGEPVAEGETGLIQVFDLANLGSVLAVETRDLGVHRGDGFELLGRDPLALPRGCSRPVGELLGL